ncbi:hypothetical protein K501DRAFT_94474 [Backusella circina FSU 941]|nr:hypothetical protein K501DRAFT_94474 [Backusella circina FSU 941]
MVSNNPIINPRSSPKLFISNSSHSIEMIVECAGDGRFFFFFFVLFIADTFKVYILRHFHIAWLHCVSVVLWMLSFKQNQYSPLFTPFSSLRLYLISFYPPPTPPFSVL